MSDLTNYFDWLGDGQAERLGNLFSKSPSLDDPRAGHVMGNQALTKFVRESQEWLGSAQAEIIALTECGKRAVTEFVLHVMREGKKIPLPVAIAADKDGEKYSAIRVYFSMWPLLGRHVIRKALLPEDKTLVMHGDAVGAYHDALTRGDLEGILSVFEDNGYAREPAGGEWIYQGKEKLRKFYELLFGNGGGILLEHCTLTDDGIRAALEYNAVSWGKAPLGRQAGIAVYERGTSGRLHAARIYDDVDPPV